jgi:hypothetical protein
LPPLPGKTKLYKYILGSAILKLHYANNIKGNKGKDGNGFSSKPLYAKLLSRHAFREQVEVSVKLMRAINRSGSGPEQLGNNSE